MRPDAACSSRNNPSARLGCSRMVCFLMGFAVGGVVGLSTSASSDCHQVGSASVWVTLDRRTAVKGTLPQPKCSGNSRITDDGLLVTDNRLLTGERPSPSSTTPSRVCRSFIKRSCAANRAGDRQAEPTSGRSTAAHPVW
jgi:hypothetical protein